MSWSVKRRLIYGGIFVLIVLAILSFPLYSLFHQPPSCTDGKQDQGEQGVDCGGPCIKLCKPLEAAPVTLWQRVFNIENDAYTAVAYVENPNTNAEAFNVPYEFDLYGSSGGLIQKIQGTTHLPPGKNIAVVQPDIISSTTIASVDFSFGNFDWLRPQPNIPALAVANIILSASSSPTVQADIKNSSYTAVGRVNVAAIVYDESGNAVAASETYLDGIAAQSQGHVVFTWPKAFPTETASCAAPADIMLAIDRSGSMNNGANPPEPITDVKNAALDFVKNLDSDDKAGLVSFATTPSNPLDMPLTDNFSDLDSAISQVSVHTDGTQYTDIGDTVQAAAAELSGNGDMDAKKAIILLTDGVANMPDQAGNSTYPSTFALSEASSAKGLGIEIFTIGLGTDVDSQFLQNIASAPADYYSATSSSDLAGIYGKISMSICQKQPVRAEIITDIPND